MSTSPPPQDTAVHSTSSSLPPSPAPVVDPNAPSSDSVSDSITKEIVRATQYGNYDICRSIIDSGRFNVNQRDGENVTLLHWAAINNRLELVKYYIACGAIVNAIGGDLKSTPLHWATRQGHIAMVVLLMRSGADASLQDGDGYNCLHLAAQFGHTSIAAYFIAQGVDINAPDSNGMTPLMWAAFRNNT